MQTKSAEHRELQPGIRVTNHAILRYLERVEQCTRREAVDRLCHALQISEPATKRHTRLMHGERGRRHGPIMRGGLSWRYCAVESLMIATRPIPGAILIVTMFKIVLPN